MSARAKGVFFFFFFGGGGGARTKRLTWVVHRRGGRDGGRDESTVILEGWGIPEMLLKLSEHDPAGSEENEGSRQQRGHPNHVLTREKEDDRGDRKPWRL
jgi:hypothetical protein